ncbi:MAG: hypothetical protein GX443_08095 [Deltaproteobacteria bacterium]|nr:hypothetical protein [Deltaproteobacteria bacterium]
MPRLIHSPRYMEKMRGRHRLALARAEQVCLYVISLGAQEVYLFGSGLTDDFGEHSDIGFAVRGLSSRHMYAVEAQIEVHLHGMPSTCCTWRRLPNILRTVVRYFDGEIPTGEEWRVRLLLRARNPNAGIRPSILTPGTLSLLKGLRGFRHVFRGA